MQRYTPPIDDIRFILNEVLCVSDLSKELPYYASYDWGTMCQFLDTASDYAVKTALPLNVIGDRQGCRYDRETRTVKTPDGFKAAFKKFAEIGMIGLTGSEQYGGLQAPHVLNAAATELMTAANFSLASYGGLTSGAARALEIHGSDELKALFLPKLYSGQWTGTMCLTEEQAGTDLGLLKTRMDADGLATGRKIYISCGEHDLAENICHLILARLPDAPPGIKGISLFMAPKFLPDEQGEKGEPNQLYCAGLWEKMGIHGSATCTMEFEGAKGWLVGEKHKGMSGMFAMMNHARMSVGLQGLGLATIANQNAVHAAMERIQGSRITEARDPEAERVRIIEHMNIRGELMDERSMEQGMRGLIAQTNLHQDLASHHPEKFVRERSEDYVALMTPIVKSLGTDMSVAAAQQGIKIPGGQGFIIETGVEQFYRDALIGTIYEGTNHIQAMDFVFRKVLDPKDFLFRSGLVVTSLYKDIFNVRASGLFPDEVVNLEQAMKMVGSLANDLALKGVAKQLDDILLVSKDFLDLYGYMAIGQVWLKMMNTAHKRLDDTNLNETQRAYYRNQITLGQHFIQRVMTPRMAMLASRVEAATATVANMTADDLAPPKTDCQIGIEARDSEVRHPAFKGNRFVYEAMTP